MKQENIQEHRLKIEFNRGFKQGYNQAIGEFEKVIDEWIIKHWLYFVNCTSEIEVRERFAELKSSLSKREQ